MIDKKLVKYIETTVLQSAKQTREAAGYDGRYDDGGASVKENNLKYWLSGINGQIPDAYSRLVENYKRQQLIDNDHEYREYLRLQEKFK